MTDEHELLSRLSKAGPKGLRLSNTVQDYGALVVAPLGRIGMLSFGGFFITITQRGEDLLAELDAEGTEPPEMLIHVVVASCHDGSELISAHLDEEEAKRAAKAAEEKEGPTGRLIEYETWNGKRWL